MSPLGQLCAMRPAYANAEFLFAINYSGIKYVPAELIVSRVLETVATCELLYVTGMFVNAGVEEVLSKFIITPCPEAHDLKPH